MIRTFVLSTVAFAAMGLLSSSSASAQEMGAPSYFDQHVKAPREALELSVGTGYTQGLGNYRSTAGNAMKDFAGAGLGVDAGIGYRLDPRWHLDLRGEYQEFDPGTRTAGGGARGLALGIDASYHILPYQRLDPWVQLGTGYRMFWEAHNPGPNILSHGFQLARLVIGVDVRTTPQVAIGPMIGADVSTFLFQSSPNAPNVVSDYGVATFVYAGLQGRFDVTGKTESGPGATLARQ